MYFKLNQEWNSKKPRVFVGTRNYGNTKTCHTVVNLIIFSNYSATSHGFYSDVHWKCGEDEHTGWYSERFDDRSWEDVDIVADNHWIYSGTEYESFPDTSKMVKRNSASTNLYCRARLCYGS